jgi:23S rRNA pseudoU1915 N3-methylase RlmH
MGNSQSIRKINFEDIQYIIKNQERYIIINTLPVSEQDCLLPGTMNTHKEEEIMNHLLQNGKKEVNIIIYGKNCNDNKLYTKYQQLTSLGFYNVFVYPGGLFEWLLLQDIYGSTEFPTTKKELDLLRFKPNKILNVALLEY